MLSAASSNRFTNGKGLHHQIRGRVHSSLGLVPILDKLEVNYTLLQLFVDGLTLDCLIGTRGRPRVRTRELSAILFEL